VVFLIYHIFQIFLSLACVSPCFPLFGSSLCSLFFVTQPLIHESRWRKLIFFSTIFIYAL
jgi:hypothetical protein